MCHHALLLAYDGCQSHPDHRHLRQSGVGITLRLLHKMESTHTVEAPGRLMEELRLRKKLCKQYRRSFLNVISLFGPAIFTTIVNRHGQRDMRLITEADKAVVVCMAERGPSGASEAHIRLKTQVELYTILCTEYRNLYFSAINLIGGDIFNFVEDHHRQRDGVIETDAARMDDMIERIRCAAN